MSDTETVLPEAPATPENPDAEAEALLSEVEADEAPEAPTELTPDEMKAALAKKDEIIRQQHARLQKLKPKSPGTITPSVDGKIVTAVQRLELAEEKRQFGYEHGLAPDETDYLFKINPKPSKALLDDPFIKGGLQAIRAKKRAESNTPSIASRAPRFEMPKKEDLTAEDKQAAFEKFRDARLKAR